MKDINLEINPSVFNNIYLKYQLKNLNRYQIYYGGSSSGKSVSLAQRCVLDVLKGRNYLIVRNVGNTLRNSCFNEIKKQIYRFKLDEYFKINGSEMVITCLINNKQIILKGLDDSEKIKSITPLNGVITDIWIEEATECNYRDVKQLDKRLRGISDFKKRLTLSFNPILKEHWIYKEYFNIWEDNKQYVESNDTSILKTTYKDNHFLTDDDILSLENEQDEYYYQVYTLGNWGVLGNVIFKNWTVKDLSNIKDTFDNYYNGLDFGFSKDPDALVRMHYDSARKILYIVNELYEVGQTSNILADKAKEIIGKEIITCDSAEPRMIDELRRQGVNAYPAKKGKDSVLFGIDWIQRQKIIIDISCQNTKNEFQKYRWQEDKNGNILQKPVDKDNHLIDAIRYGCESIMDAREIKSSPIMADDLF